MTRRLLFMALDFSAYMAVAIPASIIYGIVWGVAAGVLVLIYGLACYMDRATQ